MPGFALQPAAASHERRVTQLRVFPVWGDAIGLRAVTAAAQSPTDSCKPTHVIPLTNSEPAAKIVIDPPLAEPLASRGVATE